MADLLTRFGFPGASNGPEPAPQIKYLPRIGKNPGDIEYIAHVTPDAHLIVFVCHGRGRGLDKRGVDQWAELARQEGVSVVLHNYPGYGTTPGPRTEAQLCEDILQLAEHIRNEEWATGAELVVLGNSIGTGPALWMATQRQLQIKKLVLVSPYTSVAPLVPLWLVKQLHTWLKGQPEWLDKCLLNWLDYFSDPSGLSWIQGSKYDPFPPKKVACKLDKDAEVLILHGAVDDVIPVAHGKAVMEAIQTVEGVNAKMCVIAESQHRDTRIRGNDAIFSFYRGSNDLDELISNLELFGSAKVNPVGSD